MSSSLRDGKKHINFFNINFLPPTQNAQFWALRKKFMCLISWERTQKRNPHKLFRGEIWRQKGGPKRAILGCKKFSLLFSSYPYESCCSLFSPRELSGGDRFLLQSVLSHHLFLVRASHRPLPDPAPSPGLLIRSDVASFSV